MTTPNDGGPAFPIPSVGTGDPRDGMTCGSQGMSMWDFFAAAALQGLLSNNPCWQDYKEAVHYASKAADAMLADRERRMK